MSGVTRRGRESPGLSKRRQPGSCADLVRDTCARAGHGGTWTRPRQAAPPNRKSNFQWPPGVLLRALDPSPSHRQGRRLSAALHPTTTITTTYTLLSRTRVREPLTTPPGLRMPPRVRGAFAARCPWGERETVQTVGARSLAAASAENAGAECLAEEAGAESARLRSLAPRGDPERRQRPACRGRAPGRVGGGDAPSPGINYCLGARARARAAPEAQRPSSRPPAPRRKS